MNRGVGAVLGMVSALMLVGCGGGSTEPVDPIEISTSAIDPGALIGSDAEVDDDTGAFVAEQWPSACALVDKATVQSIFPQSTGVAQSGTPRDMKFISVMPGASSPAYTVTVPHADCRSSVGFPQPGLGLSDGNVVVNFTSSVKVAGTEEFVDANTKASMSGEPTTDVGDGACSVSTGVYYCDTGNVIFSIGIDMRQTNQYTKAPSSDYVVDGESYSFNGFDGQFETIARDKVLIPVVEAALARLK